MSTPDPTKRLLEASIRLQKIIKARQQLLLIGGCEDAIEKLDVKIFHLSGIRKSLNLEVMRMI
jgi:hypothetical protein